MSKESNQFVKDFMVDNLDVIKDDGTVEEIIEKLINPIVRKSGYKTESIMVVDRYQNSVLVGVVTIFDILYHLRPSFLHHGFHGDFYGNEVNWIEQIPSLVDSLKKQRVSKIMSRNIVSTTPEEHIMSVIDSMIKNKYRRLPVVKESKLVGVVYFADIYSQIFS